MRTALTVALTMIAAVVVDTAEAKAAQWCAVYGYFGATNCGFYSREQCQAALSGNGGYCRPNYADGARSDKTSRALYR
jgi:Protein of unknown function (DUF3551)